MAKKAPPAGDDPEETGIVPAGIDNSSPEKFLEFRPNTYNEIVKAYAAGCGIRKIATACKIGVATVYQILRHAQGAIKDEKAHLARAWTETGIKATALLYECLEDCDGKELAIIAGIATEKKLLLEGEPGQIVEHRVAAQSVPLNSVLGSTVETIEVTSELVAEVNP